MSKSAMPAAAFAVTALLALSPALAQGRPSTVQMSCARAAALVQAQGSMVLGTGGMTYDRFVSDRRFCAPTEQTKPAFVPAADTAQCLVGYTCIEPFMTQPDGFR